MGPMIRWVLLLVCACLVLPARAATPVRAPVRAPIIAPAPKVEESSVDGWLTRAREAQSRGMHKRAIEMAEQAMGAAPKDPRPYYVRAHSYEATRQFGLAETDLGSAIELSPTEPALVLQRGTLRLKMAEFPGAVGDLDRYVELRPGKAPELWQRGIALFYAGRYADGRKQFELHRTVNPGDVENSAWHYACIAKLEGAAAARSAWLPVSGDSRVPMSQIQDLFLGKATPEDVLRAAEGPVLPAAQNAARFYAHFYLSLFHGTEGRRELEAKGAAEAAKLAPDMGLMGDIARVHEGWVVRQLQPPTK